MINYLAACNPEHLVLDFLSKENANCITLIICISIIVTVLICLIFLYRTSKACQLAKENEQIKKEKKEIEEKLIESQPHKLTEKQQKEKEAEEKKKKEFLDYCYKMAKSLEKGNEKQREDCWKILLHNHAECIPDELKKEYKVGKQNDYE